MKTSAAVVTAHAPISRDPERAAAGFIVARNQRLSAVHVPALDGLRGLAILAVLWTHFGANGVMTPISAFDETVAWTLSLGWVGVDLFFVLSGYLITGILLDTSSGAHYFRNFYTRRVLRIFPLYYGYLAVLLGVLPLVYTWPQDDPSPAVSPLWAWTYLTNVSQALNETMTAAPPVSGHFWSLAIEEQFYLVWPAIVFLVSRRQLAFVCLAAILLSPIMRMLFVANERYIAATVFTAARVDTLAMGALLAIVVRSSVGSRLPAYVPPVVAAVGAVGFLAAQSLLLSWGFLWVMPVSAMSLVSLFGALVLMAIDNRSTAARLLSRPTMRFFGRYSYGLYVLHVPILYFIQRYVFTIDDAPTLMGTRLVGLLLFSAIAGAASVAAAYLSWHLYEKQFLTLKDRFAYKPAAAATLAT